MGEAVADDFFEAVVGGLVVGACFRQVGLGDEAAREVVWVEVAMAVAEFLGALVVGVAEVGWDGECATGGDVVECGGDGAGGAVAFGGGGDVEGGVGEDEPGLWHADDFGGLVGGECDL